MAKYQIDSIQSWPSFEYDGSIYSLSHLDAHEITYKGQKQDYKFVVTYGRHCFAKDATPYNIPLIYEDGREKITICMGSSVACWRTCPMFSCITQPLRS
ncbi:hypothetical protein NOM74_25340, partial [Klebsiella quasipneumoniae]|nr:hypothetical protein [Klebsiella quasipneumoniae]